MSTSRYAYVAVLSNGQRVTGVCRSRTHQDAVKRVLELGYHPIEVNPIADALDVREWFRRRVSVTELAVFTRQLGALLKAGLTILQALSTLRQQAGKGYLQEVIRDLEDMIARDARSFAAALDEHPEVFDPVYRGLVRSGEESGTMSEVLFAHAGYLTRSAKIRGQISGAFVYPAFLLLMGMNAIFVLITWVIPKFKELFDAFGQTLPLPTRILIFVSDFCSQWWWVILVALGIGVFSFIRSLKDPAFRLKVDAFLLRLPVIGSMLLKVELARMAMTLGMMMNSGVRILDALKITSDTVVNSAIKAKFPAIIKGVSEGDTIAQMMGQAETFPPLVLSLVKTGEETGDLPGMLSELAYIYEDEAERAIMASVRLIEPMLIVGMGLIIAGIVAAVILPIFQANEIVS